jgi:hypothetical protein
MPPGPTAGGHLYLPGGFTLPPLNLQGPPQPGLQQHHHHPTQNTTGSATTQAGDAQPWGLGSTPFLASPTLSAIPPVARQGDSSISPLSPGRAAQQQGIATSQGSTGLSPRLVGSPRGAGVLGGRPGSAGEGLPLRPLSSKQLRALGQQDIRCVLLCCPTIGLLCKCAELVAQQAGRVVVMSAVDGVLLSACRWLD